MIQLPTTPDAFQHDLAGPRVGQPRDFASTLGSAVRLASSPGSFVYQEHSIGVGDPGVLHNERRDIPVDGLVDQINKQGYINVILLDDDTGKLTGSHGSHMRNQFWDSIPGALKPYVHLTFVDLKAHGRQNLSQALGRVEDAVGRGAVQLVFGGADLRSDLRLDAINRRTGRDYGSMAEVTKGALAEDFASFRRGQPVEAALIARVERLARRVPFLSAGGNGLVDGPFFAYAPAVMVVQATRGRNGAPLSPQGYADAQADGSFTVASVPSPLAPASSYASAHAAGILVTDLLRRSVVGDRE